MNRNTFKKHINQLEVEELKEELFALFTKVKGVKNYYLMELGDDKQRQKIYNKAKKEITAKYATKSYRRPRRPRIQKIKTIIKSLENESILPYELIDIYLHNSEVAIAFMMEYSFYSTPLTNSINNTFIKALELIDSELMKSEYEERCLALTNEMNFMPWPFYNSMSLFLKVYAK
ncbi:MAG: DUF6155 family protein [Saprospiraceae bacterium]